MASEEKAMSMYELSRQIIIVFTSLIVTTMLYLLGGCTFDAVPKKQSRTEIILPTPVPIPEDWVLDSKVEQNSPLSFDFADNIVTTANGDLWMTTWPKTGQDQEHLLLRYVPMTRSFRSYAIVLADGVGVPTFLLTAQNDTLWAGGFFYTKPHDLRQKSILHDLEPPPWMLSRYDPSTDKFVQVHDEHSLLRGYRVVDMAEDRQGNIWLLIDNSLSWRLIRFSPTSQKVEWFPLSKSQIQFSFNSVTHIAIAPDGALWFSAFDSGEITSARIIRYDFTADNSQDFGKPLGSDVDYNPKPVLYFDRSGTLWTSNIARLTFPPIGPPIWQPAVQPGVFKTERMDGIGHPGWYPPYQIYQTSDNAVWLPSVAGLVRYDPFWGTWTLVHNYSSKVVEDMNHDLWIAADNNLYRHHIDP